MRSITHASPYSQHHQHLSLLQRRPAQVLAWWPVQHQKWTGRWPSSCLTRATADNEGHPGEKVDNEQLDNSLQAPTDVKNDDAAPSRSAGAWQSLQQRPRTFSSIAEGSSRGRRPPSQQQRLQQRLDRLLSGRFLYEAGDGGEQQQQPGGTLDSQWAAIEFELRSQQATAAADAAERQRVDSEPTTAQHKNENSAAAASVIVDMLPHEQQQQQQQQVSLEDAALLLGPPWLRRLQQRRHARAAGGGGRPVPAATQLLLLATWGVLVWQWWPMGRELWRLAIDAHAPLQAVLALLLASPDTPLTQMLCLDCSELLHHGAWQRILSAGLLHSGALGAWVGACALQDSGRWLELGTGPLTLLLTYALGCAGAAAGHLLLGETRIALCGPGAVLGVYVAWCLQAARHLRGTVPLKALVARCSVLTALWLSCSLLQPAACAASLAGGAIGGAVAAVAAAPLARALRWALAGPVLVSLFAVKLLLDAGKVLLLATISAAGAVSSAAAGLVTGVRRL